VSPFSISLPLPLPLSLSLSPSLPSPSPSPSPSSRRLRRAHGSFRSLRRSAIANLGLVPLPWLPKIVYCRVSRFVGKMVKLTMIARITDGLPLAEGLDDGRDQKDADFYKQQAKLLFKNLSKGHYEASRMSIETGPYYFHYIIEGRVCYLTMCDRSYPKKLAFQYLEDLKNEFERVNGNQIETAARPYAFIKFDTFIQKTKKLYMDTRTQRNLAKLNDELYEVHQIMTRNVQEVLGVGEKLDQVSEMSSRLTSESRIYADKAKDLNRQALIRKWAPVAIVLGVVMVLFWVKTKIW
ncbi:25.3 kDa vesicle transport protein, partial [Ananas comosus]